jgi:hypothetical protein
VDTGFRKGSCSAKSMIPKSGYRFSERIMLRQEHDPEKWIPVFGKDHAPPKG